MAVVESQLVPKMEILESQGLSGSFGDMVRKQLQLAHGTHEPEEEDNTHAGKPWKLPSTGGGALHSGDAARAAAGHFTAHLPYVTLVWYLHPDSLQLVAVAGMFGPRRVRRMLVRRVGIGWGLFC